MLHPLPGVTIPESDMMGSRLIIPSRSIGLGGHIACDLFVLNNPGCQRLGYFLSENISPGVSSDGLEQGDPKGVILMPCEIFFEKASKTIIFLMRGGLCEGKYRNFCEEVNAFCRKYKVSMVHVFTQCVNPIRKERISNRE